MKVQRKLPPVPWTRGMICVGSFGLALTAGKEARAPEREVVVAEAVSGPWPKPGWTGPTGKG